MMRDGIDLFGYNFKREVLSKKSPEIIFEFISPVGTIPMMPNGTMAAHYDHAVNKSYHQTSYTEVFEDKQNKKGGQAQNQHPTRKGEPVFFVPEYI
jgi:hypothetical protein